MFDKLYTSYSTHVYNYPIRLTSLHVSEPAPTYRIYFLKNKILYLVLVEEVSVTGLELILERGV